MEPRLGNGLTSKPEAKHASPPQEKPTPDHKPGRPRWVYWLAGLVVTTLLVALVLGLTRPDGTVGDSTTASTPTPAATTSPPEPTPTPTPTTAAPSADLAPEAVEGVWPGRPDGVSVDGESVDWCPAVNVDASQAAVSTFGSDGTQEAACAAISFVFNERYSRRSLPKESYRSGQFSSAVDYIAAGTQGAYRARVEQYVRQPGGTNAERLGLILLNGTPGDGYRFYGAANTLEGYADRAAWINPTWSDVAVSLDTSRSTPRLIATFTASADTPVFDTSNRTDSMMTVPTRSSMTLRNESGRWVIGGFDITTGSRDFGDLVVK